MNLCSFHHWKTHKFSWKTGNPVIRYMIVKHSQAPSFLLPVWHLSEVSSLPPRKCFDWGCFRRAWKKREGEEDTAKREKGIKNMPHTSQWARPHSGIDRLPAWVIVRVDIQHFSHFWGMLLCFCSVDKINLIKMSYTSALKQHPFSIKHYLIDCISSKNRRKL